MSATIHIEGLTISVGGRTLLSESDATFPAGKVTLIVGPSGAGKTVLMRVLAGLLRPGESGFELGGRVRLGEEEILGGGASSATAVGIVFQNFALFDELSPVENIRFARDHRVSLNGGTSPPSETATETKGPSVASTDSTPEALLSEFSIPAGTPVSALSGGQKQRLAIARTLAYNPPVILYDEPTSGLDPGNAQRVAQRIRATGQAHGKTTVVVTHDYPILAPIADTVYFLDADAQTLRALEEPDVEKLAELTLAVRGTAAPGPPVPPSLAQRALTTISNALESTGGVLEKALTLIAYLLPLWRSAHWGLRYLWHYFGLIASPSSCLYFGAAGLIAGFVSTHFVFEFLPHRQYTEPLLIDELLTGLGFAQYRILLPVLLTVLLAARCAAAAASDVGSRVYAHQLDALRSMGVSPPRYLLTNILYAFLIATPLLVGIGFVAAKYTSLAVFVYNFPEHGAHYWDGHFHRDLRVPGEFLYWGSGWLLGKVLLAGLGVGAIAYFIGVSPKSSAVEVSRGITTTIIAATLYVLLVHFAFAFLEF